MRASNSDYLYVMQAVSGRVKIGRTADPEKRRRSLETASGHRVFLIAALPNMGRRELSIHIRLKAYRLIGEWFSGTPEGQAAIERVVGTRLLFRFVEKPELPEATAIARNDRITTDASAAFKNLAEMIAVDAQRRPRRRRSLTQPG